MTDNPRAETTDQIELVSSETQDACIRGLISPHELAELSKIRSDRVIADLTLTWALLLVSLQTAIWV